MSTDPQTTGSSSGSGGGAAKAAAEPRYTRDELPEYLGVAPHIVVGALHGERNETFTITQAQKAIAAWPQRELHAEMAQGDPDEEE